MSDNGLLRYFAHDFGCFFCDGLCFSQRGKPLGNKTCHPLNLALTFLKEATKI